MSIRVRPANVADAPALSRLAAKTFHDTFAADNRPEDMAHYLAATFAPAIQAAEIGDPAGVVLLAEHVDDAGGASALIGYAQLAAHTVPAAVTGPAPIEIKRLYVARDWHGRGVAQALMVASLDAARARGRATLWLGVWERNARAAAFYARHGFVRVGEHAFVLGADVQTDWLLVRPVD